MTSIFADSFPLMTSGELTASNHRVRAYRSAKRLRLLPGDRAKALPSTDLHSEADKRREQREIAKEQTEEAKEERDERSVRLTRRVAISAVVASLIVGTATSTVAVVSMNTTRAQAQATLDSSDRRADKSFLRDQQKTAYADFYAAAVQVLEVIVPLPGLFLTPRPSSLPVSASPAEVNEYLVTELNNRMKTFSDRLNAFIGKYALVYMSGSDETVAAATKVRDFFKRGVLDAVNSRMALATVDSARGWQAGLDGFCKSIEPGDQLIASYLDSVRRDYGPDRVK